MLFVMFCLSFIFFNTTAVSAWNWPTGPIFKWGMTDAEREEIINEASGGGILASVGRDITEGGLTLLRQAAAWLLTTAVKVLDFMLDGRIYDQVFFSPDARNAINIGWGLVRDFVNMFYVLILIFLAIATILRVNKFSDKKLLFAVVLSALLINFSQPITIAVVDASNLAMNFFAKQINVNGTGFGEVLLTKVKLAKAGTGNVYGGNGAYVSAFAEIIFTAVFAITIFVLAIALLIRLIAFWVLIVLSPLAFFGLTLPGTMLSSLWNGWLSKLVNYAFFGPVLLFFLWLSLVLVNALSLSKMNSTIPGINDPISSGKGLDTVAINMLAEIIPFVAAIYLLFYGYSISRDMAAKAGNAAGSIFNKGQNWMNKGARYAAIAGTGGVGLAAYGAYKGAQAGGKAVGGNIKGAAQAYGRGLVKRAGFDNADEKKRKNEEREASLAGGDTLKDFNRKRMNEQIKDWKDKGDPSADEQARIERKGTRIERMALAMHRAEKGKLNTAKDYEKAMEAMGDDSVSAAKLRGLASKKNLDAVMRSDLDKAGAVTARGGSDAELDAEIQKNGTMKDLIKAEEGRSGTTMDAAAQRAYLRRLNTTRSLQSTAYQNKIRSMSKSEIGEQDVNFFRNAHVRSAIRNQVNDPSLSQQQQDAKREEWRRFADRDKNMNSTKEQELRGAGVI